MPAQRCSELIAAAMYEELPESWMAPQPILLFTYIGQYFKSLYFHLGPKIAGPSKVEAFKKGESGYGSLERLIPFGGAGGGNKSAEEVVTGKQTK